MKNDAGSEQENNERSEPAENQSTPCSEPDSNVIPLRAEIKNNERSEPEDYFVIHHSASLLGHPVFAKSKQAYDWEVDITNLIAEDKAERDKDMDKDKLAVQAMRNMPSRLIFNGRERKIRT